MNTHPGLLLWVTELEEDAEWLPGATVLTGIDFGAALGGEPGPVPEILYALQWQPEASGEPLRTVVPGSSVRRVQGASGSWGWQALEPASFPRPPFLLTDDLSYHFLFHGTVEIRPSSFVLEQFKQARRTNRLFFAAIAGEDWWGVLTASPYHPYHRRPPQPPHRAHLIAFSRVRTRELRFPAEVQVPEFGEAFGELAEPLREQEVWDFLQAVERGEITLTPDQEPQEVYAGAVSYQASNGWSLSVFNDANQWDYLEDLETNDGRSIGYDELDPFPRLDNYEVSEEVSWSRYRIPGYLRFRCPRCERWFRDGPALRDHDYLRCPGHRQPGGPQWLRQLLQALGQDKQDRPDSI